MENRSSSLFKYFSFPCRRIKDSLVRVNEILSRRWNDRACNRLARKSSWSLILFHAKMLCAERFLSPPLPSVRFLSGGGHRGNNGLIFQRFTTRAENYVETEDRRGSWVAPVFYCLESTLEYSILPCYPHDPPCSRYSILFLSLSCCRHRFPDTVTKHAAPCNAGARLYNAALRYCVADVVAMQAWKVATTFFKDVRPTCSTRI